jgi:pimeloyl-ACP methyl ester carboxylesterase
LRAYANKMERGLEPLVDASLRVTYPPELIHDQAVFEAFRARWVSNDPASFAGKYRMLIDLDIRADFAKVRCPTLLIAGSKDPLLTPANVEGLARAIPGARTVEIDSGHFMATQTPGLVIDAIGAFLADLGISSS